MPIAQEIQERHARRVGSTIRGKYHLDRLAGVGGMAAVFAATHRNGSHVALKILHAELADDPDLRRRFLREGYIANRIPHPGIVRVIDDDEDDDGATVFLVLEWVEGETLEARRQSLGGRMPVAHAVDVAARLLDVLGVAHDEQVVHRDVKPSNVFLTQGGELRVFDFGIARVLEGTARTRTGDRMGTPAFMSPEQAGGRNAEIDARSDLWSAGALLFTLLAGRHVHAAKTRTEQEIYAATQAAPPLASVASWVPRDVARVVDRALAFDRGARWPGAREMADALRRTLR